MSGLRKAYTPVAVLSKLVQGKRQHVQLSESAPAMDKKAWRHAACCTWQVRSSTTSSVNLEVKDGMPQGEQQLHLATLSYCQQIPAGAH